MPRPSNVDPLRAAIQFLGHQIGLELAGTMAPSQKPAVKLVTRGPGRPRLAAKYCIVPGCSRRKSARNLCNGHYGKARKGKMNLDKLGPADLRFLGQDGRSLRFKKIAPAALSRTAPKRRKARK